MWGFSSLKVSCPHGDVYRGGGGEWDRAGTLVEAFVAMGIKGYPGTHQCEDGDAGII